MFIILFFIISNSINFLRGFSPVFMLITVVVGIYNVRYTKFNSQLNFLFKIFCMVVMFITKTIY